MRLDLATYRDKVLGCWVGKNIGGVLGAPFEGRRQFNDNTFYAQDLREGPPANDDLDLQIVWLAAVERYGRQVDAAILGDYWLSYIIPNWVEYGMGKANMRAGFQPPISGSLDNDFKTLRGLHPFRDLGLPGPGQPGVGRPLRVRDAVVDHAEDGMHAEVFCAALQRQPLWKATPIN